MSKAWGWTVDIVVAWLVASVIVGVVTGVSGEGRISYALLVAWPLAVAWRRRDRQRGTRSFQRDTKDETTRKARKGERPCPSCRWPMLVAQQKCSNCGSSARPPDLG